MAQRSINAVPTTAVRGGGMHTPRRTELILRELKGLPTLPAVATKLMELGAREDVDVREIVRLIEVDPALTARLLSLCRRAAYKTRHPITTVEMAVVMLGIDAVRSLVLSVQIFEWTDKLGKRGSGGGGGGNGGAGGINRVGFWQHAIAVASCADLLSREHPELDLSPEESFVCGLTLGLGKLALDVLLPKAYARVVELSGSRQGNIADFERPIVGLDHHQAGRRLAEMWQLPEVIRDCIEHYERPFDELPAVPHRRAIAVVGVADAVCRKLGLGWSGNHTPSDERAMAERAGLTWARVQSVIARLYEATSARCRDLGLGEEPSQQLLVESILRANEKLGRLNQQLGDAYSALESAQAALSESRTMARLGEMTAGAAHEMNNPLTVISGRAQQLLSRAGDDQSRAALRSIVEASGRLTGLISRLHRIARPPEPRPAPTDLKELLSGAIAAARERVAAGAGGAEVLTPGVKLTVADGLEPARLDAGLMGDALVEVIVNALESRPRSPVEVRAHTRTSDDRLVIQVVDDGGGMSEHALEHALDPFFSEKPAGRQAGLGLALAHRMVQAQRGVLELSSKPGRGTSVSIVLERWRWSREGSAGKGGGGAGRTAAVVV